MTKLYESTCVMNLTTMERAKRMSHALVHVVMALASLAH